MQVTKPEHVLGKHNPHLESLIRLTADEALFAGDPRQRNALYTLITEPLTIEPKFVDAYQAANHLNIDILSNQDHYVPVSGTARRIFALNVSEDRVGDFDYFNRIQQQLEDEGGYEALLYHLLHEIDISDFNVRAVPKTAALLEQAAYSRKGVDLLVETACVEAVVPCQRYDANFSECSDDTNVYNPFTGFDTFIAKHSDQELRRLGPLAVKRKLATDWGCLTGKAARKWTSTGGYVFGIIWPPLQELRSRFANQHGMQDWNDDEDWLAVDGMVEPQPKRGEIR